MVSFTGFNVNKAALFYLKKSLCWDFRNLTEKLIPDQESVPKEDDCSGLHNVSL